ncbi:MAG: GNAT family N-acetyltransferase [Candidatus Thorarchaeota archaeon]
MPANFVIEKALKNDLSAIESLLKIVKLPVEGVESFLDNFLVVRKSEGDNISEAIFGCIGLESYGANALLRSLAIHPDIQGQGMGKRLVERITRDAQERGISSLYVLTETAEELIKKLGFTVTSRDKVSEALLQSVEFTTLCADATLLVKEI